MATKTLSGTALDNAHLVHGYGGASHRAGNYVTVHGPALPGQAWPIRVTVPTVIAPLPAPRTNRPSPRHIAMTAAMAQALAPATVTPAALPANEAHVTALVMAQDIVDRYRAGKVHGTTARRQLEALAPALPVSVYDLRIEQVTPDVLTSAERVALAHGDQRLDRVLPALAQTGTDQDGRPEYMWVSEGVTARHAETKTTKREQARLARLERERLARVAAANENKGLDAATRRARRRAARYGSARNVTSGIEANGAQRTVVTDTREVRLSARVGNVTSEYGVSPHYSPSVTPLADTGRAVDAGLVTRRVVWAVPAVTYTTERDADHGVETRFRWNVVAQGDGVTVVRHNGATPARGQDGRVQSVPVAPPAQRVTTQAGRVVTITRESGRTRIVSTVITQAEHEARRAADALVAAELRNGAANGL